MFLNKQQFNEKVMDIIKNIEYPFSPEFVHTHLHTEFSFLDGAGKVTMLAKKCKEVNTPLVITDHGNVAGTVRAYQACKQEGIPFIRGCEAYIKKSNDNEEEDYEGSYFHLILLPYTEEGFENINYLSSLGYTQGLTTVANRGVPVISKEWLEQHSSGIVAMSACMFGEISANIWLHYPYLELLEKIKPKYKTQLIRVGRKLIQKKKVLTKKSGLTVDDLSDEDVLDMILQKKKLKGLKDILLRIVAEATNEQIIEAAQDKEGYLDDILDIIKYYMGIFDFFYLEVQDHNFVEQRITTLIQKHLVESTDIGTKLVITNDVHYITADDWEVQDVLLCISTKKTMADKNRFRFQEHELYFKSPEELMQMFSYLSDDEKREYMKNSTEVVNICLNYQIELKEKFYPAFDIPEGFKSPAEYTMYLCIEGARALAKEMPKEFRYRIFNIIEYENMRDIVFGNIDFDTALEMVKDEKKQAQIIPMIMDGIVKSAEEILVLSLEAKNIHISTKSFDRYLEAISRVVFEFAIIVIKQIPDYFLITKQIIDFARNENILVGPGRGSAAGSVIAYLLGIVELDPLDYSLYFERFINPERNSYPDIDSDFPQRHLRHVKDSTAEYFGVDNCCGVNAFGNIKNKKAIQDSFRVYDFEAQEYNKVSKEIANDKQILETIMDNNNFRVKYLEEHEDNSPNMFKKAVDIASSITGNIRQAGTHAAGMIITPRDLDMFKKLPVMITGGKLNSQYDKNDVEYAGFLKMDLLGIRNLDIIQDTIDYVEKYRGEKINIRAIPLNDEKTFQLYRDGDTDFVFQVESGGMKDFLRRLQPKDMEDIICVLAGYRPGPMAYLEKFVKVKNKQEEAVYRHELLKPILEVTGGISFYQEQIMDIFKSLAGYSLGRADLVRRALGKKKKEILDEERHNFIYGIQAKDENGELMFEEDGTPIMEVKGCINNGIDEETASQIYEDILPFANYGFNKSHAAGYAILSYRTAYLKANYFLEYATAVLRSVQESREDLTPYANIVKSKGVQILFPDINKSNMNMDIYDFDNKVIITGLLAIKGLPNEMAGHILEERETNGLFTSYENFLERMSKYNIDKKSITALVYSGAFDCFDKNVERLLAYYEYSNAFYKRLKEIKEGKQRSIFDVDAFDSMVGYLQYIPDNNGYNLQDRLSNLCAYNNVGIHGDVTSSYKNIRNELRMSTSKWQKDEDYDIKEGVLTGVLEDAFTISKKGKAYLSTLRAFNGERIKLIISKAKVDKITDDINQYKSGMVVDIVGSFKFPKPVEAGDEEGMDDGSQGFVNNEIISFPNDIEIKVLDNPIIPLTVELDFDNMITDRDTVINYFGADNFNDVIKKVLGNFSEDNNGKRVVLKYNGHTYKSSKRVNITLDDIKKLGCTYTIK